jgi:hypothetical protein
MSTGRFFDVVQRVNSLILLTLGIAGLFLIGALLWETVGRSLRPHREPPIVTVAGTKFDESKFFLGGFERLPGIDVVRASLRSRSDDRPNFSSGGYSVTRNFLFFDLRTGRATWLHGDHTCLLPWDEVAAVGGDDAENRKTLAVLYHVVTGDTTGDGRVTTDDTGVVAISDPNGGHFEILVQRVDRVLDFQLRSDARGFVFYLSSGSLRVAQFDLTARTLTSDSDISAVPALDQSLAEGA